MKINSPVHSNFLWNKVFANQMPVYIIHRELEFHSRRMSCSLEKKFNFWGKNSQLFDLSSPNSYEFIKTFSNALAISLSTSVIFLNLLENIGKRLSRELLQRARKRTKRKIFSHRRVLFSFSFRIY